MVHKITTGNHHIPESLQAAMQPKIITYIPVNPSIGLLPSFFIAANSNKSKKKIERSAQVDNNQWIYSLGIYVR